MTESHQTSDFRAGVLSANSSQRTGGTQLTWRDYAVYAQQTSEELYRDCHVDVFHVTGPGGQGVNTSDSAVRMCHIPTGTVVVSRESRSQLQNRQTCLVKLHDILLVEQSRRVLIRRQNQRMVPKNVDSSLSASVVSVNHFVQSGISIKNVCLDV